MLRRTSSFLACIYLLSTTFQAVAAKPKVTIASGPIAGTSTKLASSTATVDQYLGIPFAKSPPERFAPPEDPTPWKKELDASAIKPACIQQFNCKSNLSTTSDSY